MISSKKIDNLNFIYAAYDLVQAALRSSGQKWTKIKIYDRTSVRSNGRKMNGCSLTNGLPNIFSSHIMTVYNGRGITVELPLVAMKQTHHNRQ